MGNRKDKLWEQVKQEFPKNPSLQQVHYARLLIREETRGMTNGEYIDFIKACAKKVIQRRLAT